MPGGTPGADIHADDHDREDQGGRAATTLLAFLRSEGAASVPHARGRTLLDHLVETAAILRRWNQPAWLQHAALMHSVYGTDRFRRRLLPLTRRTELMEIAGHRAERLAYLFCVTERSALLAGTHRWARGDSDPGLPPSRDELDALIMVHLANLAEQSQADDGSPGRWLVRLRDVAELLIDSDAVRLPLFIAELAAVGAADEALALRAYRSGLGQGDDAQTQASRLGVAASACPVVGEPCIWQAHLSRCRGDDTSANWWAQCAEKRLRDLGTAWDKRLSFEQWLRLADVLREPAGAVLPASPAAVTDPRQLFEAYGRVERRSAAAPPHPEAGEQPDAAEGRERFHRYVQALADADGEALAGVYPGLSVQPWYDPRRFALTEYLETHFEAVCGEILALEPFSFHRESERIKRSGEWDVAFFYERGRRRHELCAGCPVITRGIEAYPTMRTMTGLIYVSRMRGATHIQAHRGPTNLRVRCHLAIKVPDGDCALRVGDETRRWEPGKCLVFNDYVEHEAWNHTDEDRLVLIVDLWHPGLSATEISLLEGLHSYTYAHARRLSRYWSANADAAAAVRGA